MIHTIAVAPGLTPEELKKLLRKKLMTGGAVVRLRPGLSEAQKHELFDVFAPVAERYSAAALVLRALAQDPTREESLTRKLEQVAVPEVARDLKGDSARPARSVDASGQVFVGSGEADDA